MASTTTSSMAESFRAEVQQASAAFSASGTLDPQEPGEEAGADPATEPEKQPVPEDAEAGEEGDDVTTLCVVAPGVRVSSKTGAVVPTADGKLGTLYVAVLKQLLESSDPKVKWVHRRSLPMGARSTWDLVLSEAQGQSIPWKKLGALLSDREAVAEANAEIAKKAISAGNDAAGSPSAVPQYRPPLVNFSRGFQSICRKAMLVTTLRRHGAAKPEARVDDWFPQSFVFYPAKPERSERQQFLDAFAKKRALGQQQRQQAQQQSQQGEEQDGSAGNSDVRNVWILKPSDGGKGERIRIMDGASSVEAAVAAAAAIASAGASDAAPSDDAAGDSKKPWKQEAAAATATATATAAPVEEAGEAAESSPNAKSNSDDSSGDSNSSDDPKESPDAILAFLEGQPKGSISWVVSEYLERPLLLQPGDRKFDWRLWVLLQPDYTIRLYREGVLRTCSVPYSLGDLSDEFAHLSNHCIQEKSQAFGQFGLPTNEMFYAEWDASLSGGGENGAASSSPSSSSSSSVLREKLLPQARHIIVETLLATRETLSCDPSFTHVNAFNVFGFDLMVDADLGVKLIEVNSSPAVAETLLPDLAKDLVAVQLGSYFPASSAAAAAETGGTSDGSNGWEVIFDPSSGTEAATAATTATATSAPAGAPESAVAMPAAEPSTGRSESTE